MDLTDEQWLLIQPLLPPPRTAGGRGRPPLDQRTLINGILWKLRCNRPWRAVPSRYGSHEVCYLHYNAYKRSGVIKKILAALLKDLRTRGEFELETCLRRGMVFVVKKNDTLHYYIHPEYSDDWRVHTSLIFYYWAGRNAKKQRGERF